MEFAGQNVLVTGASRGIGRAVARAFAAQGARVLVHYHRNRGAALETLRSMAGGPHGALAADLADPAAAEHLIEEFRSTAGQIDVLVNNAGIYELHPPDSVSYAEWRDVWNRTIGANLLGPANLMYCAARHMARNGGGRIVNISSRGAFRGEPDAPAYGAAKAGLNALGQSMAKALAPRGVYVYTIAPGFVATDMVTSILEGPDGQSYVDQSPLRRVAQPEEIARTVLFLAGKGSEYMTGCIVDQNGASYLRT